MDKRRKQPTTRSRCMTVARPSCKLHDSSSAHSNHVQLSRFHSNACNNCGMVIWNLLDPISCNLYLSLLSQVHKPQILVLQIYATSACRRIARDTLCSRFRSFYFSSSPIPTQAVENELASRDASLPSTLQNTIYYNLIANTM
uniref:Uncharacterized protein n=1 Tax=Physcomitrium patens TaxID=3218 RepID=A0A2K1KAQ6_PHYPA|nr:hypothetical protein PHYPA_010047 [Physcomitrium patens]